MTLSYAYALESEFATDVQESLSLRPAYLELGRPVAWEQRLLRVWAPVEPKAEMTEPSYVYRSPAGPLKIEWQGDCLEGLWFLGTGAPGDDPWARCDYWEQCEVLDASDLPEGVLKDTVAWLDAYFAGRDPGFTPALNLVGTAFQQEVWAELLQIPFGGSVTYGDIARTLARRRGIDRMAAQAVGRAVGANPVCVVVPCHRVLGAGGRITGYTGGIAHKEALLKLEGVPFRSGEKGRQSRVVAAVAPRAVAV